MYDKPYFMTLRTNTRMKISNENNIKLCQKLKKNAMTPALNLYV